MRLLIQRVLKAHVDVEGKCVGRIEKGALVFFGSHKDDQASQVAYLANKLVHLRMFHDADGKMNLSLLDVKGSVLIVSQFTLYADCSEGRRPSFFNTAGPEIARSYYQALILDVKKSGLNVETGIFGANMQVHLINDGPVTLMIDAS
jgi:D-aminoacyl-tRNA deacylase